jgi:hypothetical protein
VSLNNPHIATTEADPIPHCGAGNQDDATPLRLKVAAKVQTKKV